MHRQVDRRVHGDGCVAVLGAASQGGQPRRVLPPIERLLQVVVHNARRTVRHRPLLPAPREPAREPRPIATAELRKLLAVRMHKRPRVMVLLAAFAGLRVHEIAKFRGEDVNLDCGVLSVQGKGGATARFRCIHLSERQPRRCRAVAGGSRPTPLARASTSAGRERQRFHLRSDAAGRHHRQPPCVAALVRHRPDRVRRRSPDCPSAHAPREPGNYCPLHRGNRRAAGRRDRPARSIWRMMHRAEGCLLISVRYRDSTRLSWGI